MPGHLIPCSVRRRDGDDRGRWRRRRSSFAARARTTYERRTLPAERTADALGEVQELLDRCAAPTRRSTRQPPSGSARQAWEQDGSGSAHDLAGVLAAELVGGRRPQPRRVGAPYWMESALWQAAGIPTVVCGPAGGGLHSDVEWVELAQLRTYAAAVATMLLRWR